MKYEGLSVADAEISRNPEARTVYMKGNKPVSLPQGQAAARSGGFSASGKAGRKMGKGGFSAVLLLQFAVAALVFTVLLGLSYLDSPGGQRVFDTVMRAVQYNLLQDEDDDIGKIKFVARVQRQKAAQLADARELFPVAPVEYTGVDNAGGILTFECADSAVIRPCESGTVSAVGFTGGSKFVEVRHNSSTVSRYQGDIVSGVRVGDLVGTADILGSAAGGELVFCVLSGGVPVASLVCGDGALSW